MEGGVSPGGVNLGREVELETPKAHVHSKALPMFLRVKFTLSQAAGHTCALAILGAVIRGKIGPQGVWMTCTAVLKLRESSSGDSYASRSDFCWGLCA